jgi:hypothetical protein
MNARTPHSRFSLPAPSNVAPAFAALVLLIFAGIAAAATATTARTPAAQTPSPSPSPASSTARTPSQVVREFYRAMREKRFREAFALSIYSPAVEGLSQAEFEELRPDFEEMAVEFPEKVEINGEQISGETATVFVKVVEGGADKLKPTELIRAGNSWIIGGRSDQAVVKERGKQFFFEARIEAHHSLVEDIMKRIAAAQLIHSVQNNGQYADLSTLVRGGHVPQEVLAPETTGYKFNVNVAKNGKAFSASAEPLRYGRTGRLSFFMDGKGLKSRDTGGKPLKP